MSNSLTLKDFQSALDGEDPIYSNAENFAGRRVQDFDPTISEDVAFRFRSVYDGDECLKLLEQHLTSEKASATTAIVIGMWAAEMHETSPAEVINLLIKHKSVLQNLKSLYLGDVVSEENEMSWIIQTDIAPLAEHFPNLEYLRSRGSTDLKFSVAEHAQLRALALETGGLEVSVLRSISMAKLPNLEHLELWLGTDEYGGNCSVEDLQPVLSGQLFPNLKYLGLRN